MTWPFENDTSSIEKKLAKQMCIRDSAYTLPAIINRKDSNLILLSFLL